MSDEAAFLSAISKSPDDTSLRLVFADWLDEHDDFRAEFVRTGVEYDRTPPYDAKRFQLGEKLRGLLEAPAFKKWLPVSRGFKWGWRRGFLTLFADTSEFDFDTEDAPEVASWLASPWIERVEFDSSRFRSSPDWEETYGLVRNTRELRFRVDNYGPGVLTRLREWPHLRALDISYLEVPWADLAALPCLRALTLDNPDWTMMPELHQARLPDLEVLDLAKEWEDNLPQWGTCFPKLRALTLTQYNAYTDDQCVRFAECPQLRHLAFFQRYQPFTTVGLKALVKLKELRSLTLGKWPRGSIDVLAKLSSLERLRGDGEAKTVRGLESLTGLRWLALGSDTFTKTVAAQTLKLPHLARFDLHCEAYEPGAIAVLAKLKALRVLTVRVQDKAPAVSELIRLEGLQYLRFSPPGIAEKDLNALRTALPNCLIVDKSWGEEEDDYDWG